MKSKYASYGMLNKKHTENTKEKIRQKMNVRLKNKKYILKLSNSAQRASKKRWQNQEYKEKQSKSISNGLKGYKKTKQHILKISDSVKRNKSLSGERNGRWKGGLSSLQKLEKLAGREKPVYCEICHRKGRIVFDHDHITGKFRGWICYKCNNGLGMADDKIKILKEWIVYLNKNNLI